jgi:hypothetical protein
VHGNPINGIDPSGELRLPELAIATALGATIGAIATPVATYTYSGRMATPLEIAQGAAFGALFAVVAWASPVLGTGIAGYGVGTSVIRGFGVANDPSIPWQRKVAAVTLFIAAAYGTNAAINYAAVAKGYIPSNPNNATLIPQGFMHSRLAIDMRGAPPSSGINAAGYPQNGRWYFRQLSESRPDLFSPANRALIAGGRAPRVDETWVRGIPEHASFLGEKLIHHHVLQGPQAVPIPEAIHTGFSSSLHIGVPNMPLMNGSAGGMSGGLAGTEGDN